MGVVHKDTTIQIRLQRLSLSLGIALSLVGLRCAYLSVWSYQKSLDAAKRPSLRTQKIEAPRGEILDRYGESLARNKATYRAGILYSKIAALPKYKIINGQKEPYRSSHVERLTHFLARELMCDKGEIEDQIYAHAALTPLKPYFFEKRLSEKQTARLNMRAHAFEGLVIKECSEREYPKGRIGAHIVGYTAPINRAQWESYTTEIRALKQAAYMHSLGFDVELPNPYNSVEEIKERIYLLEEKKQTLSDLVGCAGIEKQYDEILGGAPGKQITWVDATGAPTGIESRQIAPKPGKNINLSLSADLQEHCEKILIEHEQIRRGVSRYQKSGTSKPLAEPWIKGGAIVALDPHDGSVLALATTPRFDNSAFTKRDGQQERWLETENFLGKIWDREEPLRREAIGSKGSIVEEELYLSWNFFLHLILPENHMVRARLNSIRDITPLALALQNMENPTIALKQMLEPLSSEYDKKLFIDICSLAIDTARFSESLTQNLPIRSLEDHFKDKGHFKRVERFVREQCKAVFHEEEFAQFREKSGKAFLKEKRKEELTQGTWARPYTYYFQQKEKALFSDFWKINRLKICTAFIQGKLGSGPYEKSLALWAKEFQSGAHQTLELKPSYKALRSFLVSLEPQIASQYLHTLSSYHEIKDRPLRGHYPSLRSQTMGGLALSFYPTFGFGFMQSRAFQLPSAPGSIFKLVPAFSALMHQFTEDKPINPLTIIDEWQLKNGSIKAVARSLSGTSYPRWYKGGRLPKSAMSSIGKIDLKRALATTSNPYFALLCTDVIPSIERLISDAEFLGFGAPTGIDLPFESSGTIPCDLTTNRSGLYAFSMGQHKLTATPLQLAQMLRFLISNEPVAPPSLKKGSRKEQSSTTLYKELTQRAGIDFPLFQENLYPLPADKSSTRGPIPKPVRTMLNEGMQAVVQTIEGTAHPSHVHLLSKKHPIQKSYLKLFTSMAGKTSTAEVIETHSLDAAQKNGLYNNTWFGGISYIDDKPDLIVVVFLPYGTGGKEAAPLMASVVETYRELEKTKATRERFASSK